MNELAEFEFGAAEEVSVVLAGEASGEVTGFAEEGVVHQVEEALGMGFLLGRQRRVVHRSPRYWEGGTSFRATDQLP
jgi:hypothetical protein